MVTPLAPIKPQQPTPTEFFNWNQGATNAKQNYLQTLAKNNQSTQLAAISHANNTRQNAFNQSEQRRSFPDSYIGRGIYNSGIYGHDLTGMLVNNMNQNTTEQQNYAATQGGYQAANLLAQQGYQASLRNLRAQELARRVDLASQIKGIV